MFFHPGDHAVENFADAPDAVVEQFRGHHRHFGPGHQALEHILIGVDAAGEGQIDGDAAMQNCQPAQG